MAEKTVGQPQGNPTPEVSSGSDLARVGRGSAPAVAREPATACRIRPTQKRRIRFLISAAVQRQRSAAFPRAVVEHVRCDDHTPRPARYRHHQRLQSALLTALRQRADALKVSRQNHRHPRRFCRWLRRQTPRVRVSQGFGRTQPRPVARAVLGVKLAILEDPDAMARYEKRRKERCRTPSRRPDA